MCLSCGCGKPNDDHGDSRNITMDDLNSAAEAARTTREKVLQNLTHGADEVHPSGSSSTDQGQSQQNLDGQDSSSFIPANQPDLKPGQYHDNLGQESGTDWAESQQMGRTGRGGVQKPQEN